MNDVTLKIGKHSLLQHGPDSNRIYLMKCDPEDLDLVYKTICELEQAHGYSKIFVKVPESLTSFFLAEKFIIEAQIPNFYNNSQDAVFMAKFNNPHRAVQEDPDKLLALHDMLAQAPQEASIPRESNNIKLQILSEDHADEMAGIFKKVFASYPFPIQDPSYLIETMDYIRYSGAFINSRLVGISSSEMDFDAANAEMTDFAVLPNYRGKSLATRLLRFMEQDMNELGISSLYTIARLHSTAMTKTFINQCYRYAGTLVQNTQISGKIESMNVLYKSL